MVKPKVSITLDEKVVEGIDHVAEGILKETGDRDAGSRSRVVNEGLRFYLKALDELGIIPDEGFFNWQPIREHVAKLRALVQEYKAAESSGTSGSEKGGNDATE